MPGLSHQLRIVRIRVASAVNIAVGLYSFFFTPKGAESCEKVMARETPKQYALDHCYDHILDNPAFLLFFGIFEVLLACVQYYRVWEAGDNATHERWGGMYEKGTLDYMCATAKCWFDAEREENANRRNNNNRRSDDEDPFEDAGEKCVGCCMAYMWFQTLAVATAVGFVVFLILTPMALPIAFILVCISPGGGKYAFFEIEIDEDDSDDYTSENQKEVKKKINGMISSAFRYVVDDVAQTILKIIMGVIAEESGVNAVVIWIGLAYDVVILVRDIYAFETTCMIKHDSGMNYYCGDAKIDALQEQVTEESSEVFFSIVANEAEAVEMAKKLASVLEEAKKPAPSWNVLHGGAAQQSSTNAMDTGSIFAVWVEDGVDRETHYGTNHAKINGQLIDAMGMIKSPDPNHGPKNGTVNFVFATST